MRSVKIAIGPVFDEFGGVSRHILGIKRNSSFDVVDVPSVLYRRFTRNRRNIRRIYKMMLGHIGLRQFDIVHSHVSPWFVNLCARSRNRSCRWAHTYHTLYFKEDFFGNLEPWQELVNESLVREASSADVRISISLWLSEYLEAEYGVSTIVIPNGVDVEACDLADGSRFVQRCGLEDYVIFVGSDRAVKAPDLFIRMARELKDVPFVMVGRRLNRENIYSKYGLDVPRNVFLVGELSYRETLDAIAGCRAFVMTSKREGCPTALLEAMALRKPVVVPAHSGCLEIVESEDYGFLYEYGRLDDLVENVRKALDDKQKGKRARQRVLDIYDWRVLVKRIDDVYRELAGET